MPNIILVSPAGGGKDEFFSLLPSNYKRYAFGDNIRLVCKNLRVNGVHSAFAQLSQMFGLESPPNLLRKLQEFKSIPKHDEKDRAILQALGTWCVDYDDYIWTRPIRMIAEYKKNMCITDCRRFIEFNAFLDFVSVYIDTPYDLRLERLQKRDGTVDEQALQHKAESEIELLRPVCNFIVDNSGNIGKLQVQINEILGYINERSD